MSQREILSWIAEWIKRDGKAAVEQSLMLRGLPITTRYKILSGQFRPSKRGGLLKETLIDELKRAGFPPENKAS